MDRSNDTLAVCTGRNGIIKLAIRILSVVANSAGVECAFSDFGRTHTKQRSCLAAGVVHDVGTVRLSVRREHAAAGLATRRPKRKLGADYEPVTAPHLDITSELSEGDTDNTINTFDELGNELVRNAIDSSEPDEELLDGTDTLENEPEHTVQGVSLAAFTSGRTAADPDPAPARGQPTTTSASGPLYLTSNNMATHLNPLQPPARRRRAPKLVQIPLSKLFLYPSPGTLHSSPITFSTTSDASSPPTAALSPSDRDVELRGRFERIWSGGIGHYNRETALCEALHSDN